MRWRQVPDRTQFLAHDLGLGAQAVVGPVAPFPEIRGDLVQLMENGPDKKRAPRGARFSCVAVTARPVQSSSNEPITHPATPSTNATTAPAFNDTSASAPTPM
jgi:hypothetical protein